MNRPLRCLLFLLPLALGVAAAVGQPIAAPGQRQADSDAAFAATKVRVRANGTQLAAVVRELTLHTHIQIDLAREPVDLGDRPVTLDTGETSFWEALDALCRTAKLSFRPGDIDPTRATNLASLPTAILFGIRGIEHVLVLQDGVAATYPTALVGALPIRLIPDRWDNRDRGPGDEQRWFLEILSEPRVNWLAPPTYQFDPPVGLTANRNPQRPDNISKSKATGQPVRSLPDTAYLRELTGQTVTRVMRHEYPVYVRLGVATGPTIPELKGTLSGTVQLSEQVIATVADVTQGNAPAVAAADGTKLSVRDYRRDSDGAVALTVEVERPQFTTGNPAERSVLTRAATSGQLPVFPERNGRVVLNYLLEDKNAGLRLLDENGRPYQLTTPQDAVVVTQRGTAMAVALAVTGRPTGAAGAPRRLELLGPRRVPVEVRFTLRDVPRP